MAIKSQGQYVTEMQGIEEAMTAAHVLLERLAHHRAELEWEFDDLAGNALNDLRNDEKRSAKTVLSSSTLTNYHINGATRQKKREVSDARYSWDACRENIRILQAQLNSHQSQLRVEFPG